MNYIRTLKWTLACAAAFLAGCMELPDDRLLAPGAKMPSIETIGWINVEEISADDISGNVVVLTCFASWCGPCAKEAPKLVALHEKYAKDAKFIHLTTQNDLERPEIEQFVDQLGITWPVGYGAATTSEALGAFYIPVHFVIGRDGRVAWNSNSKGTLEQAIEKAIER